MRRTGLVNRQRFSRARPASGGSGGAAAAFVPTDVAGLVAWFDMQDTGAYTEAGGVVTTITNKASSVVWAEATNRPAFSATGLNSLPCMDLDGINDKFMDTEAAVAAALKDQLDYTIFIVAQIDDLDAIEVMFSAADADVAGPGSKRWGTNSTLAGRWTVIGTNDASSPIVGDSAGGTVTTPIVYEAYSAAQATSIQINGAAASPDALATAYGTLSADRCAIGCRPSSTLASFFDGRIGEILIYNSALSASNRSKARGYLGTKWAITVA